MHRNKTFVLPVVIITLLCFGRIVTGKFHCEGTCYSGTSPKDKDITKGKHLKGHSYKNITTDVPQNCFSSCIHDCRCKAFQIKTVRCELLEEDKTSKAGDFVLESGYVYYDLQQEFHKESSHLIQPGVCKNGCCKYQPCLNGGTCTEHCHTPKEKFTCKCTTKHYGKVCEKIIYNSCMDVLKTSSPGTTPANGTYTITRTDTKTTVPFYCAFVSPNQAWTLVESFSLANNNIFSTKAFTQNSPRYQSAPNWSYYRLSLSNMQYIRTKATMFRATCDFPNRTSLTPDFLLGLLNEVDILSSVTFFKTCKRYVHINIRTHECFNCTANSYTRNHDGHSRHPHIDTTKGNCEFTPPNSITSEDSFGNYGTPNTASRCTTTQQSTTQWWLGEQK